MAFRVEREKTGSTPYILIDEEKEYMCLEGESFHENVIEFYSEVEEWLTGFLESDFQSLTFDCELKYFNSSTAKLLLNMLLLMDEYADDTHKVFVNWIALKENDIIIECGEDFEEEMENLEFRIVLK